jgi:hypothetical protein
MADGRAEWPAACDSGGGAIDSRHVFLEQPILEHALATSGMFVLLG